VQILATADEQLAAKLISFKGEQEDKVRDGIAALKQHFPNTFDQ
jgi:phosphoribosylcarboxyaminoimidazole (NCAIR) mutase